ncbi:DNA-binding response regulator [Synechococcus sp. BS56D]|uniref:response regulator transcription factor n=1 Tax=unclassified Synechococcus TaxID=2626047 RepID=UPI00103D937B|nr:MULTISPECIES: response regulator transcription factor [unclassified Synechococcus]NDD44385.1 DNA-binding response regulator [Synechococcaceae bacterium WB9_4xB_025]TCD56528.1 DNA-binding response regulator [Synechococcus sp. BS55D]TCD59246.1 DNA-binding response regulator [Synechococcus sp. BS56D]
MISPPASAVSTARLLLVEDDESIRETVREALKAEGFEVLACGDGAEALATLTQSTAEPVDLVVLDLMLPGLGGLDLCRQLRKSEDNTPILVISARDSETDRVLGLEVGADDYLVKPFGLRELVARCRALLRRSQQPVGDEPSPLVFRHDNLCLYAQECRVTRDDKDLNLSPKEYKILELFIKNPKRVWSRDQLLERIWGIDFVGDTKTVDVHIRWLREKIEDEPSSPCHIRTVRGFGYRFG